MTCNGERLWSDGLPGRTVAVCGNLRFAAVALQGGLLQVNSPPHMPQHPIQDVLFSLPYLPVSISFAVPGWAALCLLLLLTSFVVCAMCKGLGVKTWQHRQADLSPAGARAFWPLRWPKQV